MLNKFKENIAPLSLLLSIPFLNFFYLLINTFNLKPHDMTLAIDNSIPFVKQFILAYIAWYVFVPIVMIMLCFNDKKTYYKTLIAYDMGFVLCCITYLVYQTTMTRPIVENTDVFSWMVSIIYSNDKPLNCMPSLHCLTSYLMIKGIFDCNFTNIKNKTVVSVIAFLIIISTLFVKQHVFLDAISGIALAEILYFLCTKLENKVSFDWMNHIRFLSSVRRKLQNNTTSDL